MSFKSDCNFNDFDEKRADFIYQNAIDLWKSIEGSVLLLKEKAKSIFRNITVYAFFIALFARKYQFESCLLIATVSVIIIMLICLNLYRILQPTERTLPFLSPIDLLSKDFNYDEGQMIETPKWKLKILQGIVYSDIQAISKIQETMIIAYKRSFVLSMILLALMLIVVFFSPMFV